MSFYKEVPGRQTTLESTLKFDTEPKAGSTNPVTSDGVNTAITESVGSASEALQEQIDEIAEKAGSGYTPKGPASVATLNTLSGQENGWLYTMTDAGTLTEGSLAVVAGDTVAWDATNSVWYKAMDYAPRQYGTNEVHNLTTTATEADLVSGNYLALDGSAGTKKLPANLIGNLVFKKLSAVGAGQTAVIKTFGVSRNCDFFVVKPSIYDWDFSNLSYNRLVIQGVKEDGTVVDIVSVYGTSKAYDIVIANEREYLYYRLYYRAVAGVTVDFSIIESGYLNIESGEKIIDIRCAGNMFVKNFASVKNISKIRIVPSRSTWPVTSIPTGSRILKIDFVDDENNVTELVSRYKGATITPFEVTIPSNNGCLVVNVQGDDGVLLEFTIEEVSDDIVDLGFLGKKTVSLTGADTVGVYSDKIKVKGGKYLRVIPEYSFWPTASQSNVYKYTIECHKTDGSMTILYGRFIAVDASYSEITELLPEDADTIRIFIRAKLGITVRFTIEIVDKVYTCSSFIKSVNHRGYNDIAPENTLPAFRLSAKKGFTIVETDIRQTADGKWVCIHDDTVNRTSNGSGVVSEMTLAELKALDFGSWKSPDYAGTEIPTLEEFILCCKALGLHAYIEYKSGTIADAMQVISSLDYLDKCTILSFDNDSLTYVKNNFNKVRLGRLADYFSATLVTETINLRTGENEVFLDINSVHATDANIAVTKQVGLPVEVWTVDANKIKDASPYISGYTSDRVIGGLLRYDIETGLIKPNAPEE